MSTPRTYALDYTMNCVPWDGCTRARYAPWWCWWWFPKRRRRKRRKGVSSDCPHGDSQANVHWIVAFLVVVHWVLHGNVVEKGLDDDDDDTADVDAVDVNAFFPVPQPLVPWPRVPRQIYCSYP